jgi:hypothetical protein
VGECNTGDGLLYPMEEGAWWRDHVVDLQSGVAVCPDKVVSVLDDADYPTSPSVNALPLLSERANDYGVRWQEITDDGSVHRLKDEWFDYSDKRTKIVYYCPYKIRIDDGPHACVGATWTETWSEQTITVESAANPDDCADPDLVDPVSCELTAALPTGCTNELVYESKDWEVVAVDEQVPVPAGTFTTLHVVADDGEQVTNWWWARGVGKIAEEAEDLREELVDYCLPDDCDAGPPADLDAGCE